MDAVDRVDLIDLKFKLQRFLMILVAQKTIFCHSERSEESGNNSDSSLRSE